MRGPQPVQGKPVASGWSTVTEAVTSGRFGAGWDRSSRVDQLKC